MQPGFVIMQIGDPELDFVYENAIAPALGTCGFDARRVDRHGRGGLVVSEIISFIEESEMVIADLTHERPNCYLEVGYVLGVGKGGQLILTARADHETESQDRERGGHRVHFDLAGFEILFWQPDRLAHFRLELEKRIQRRWHRIT